MLYLILFNKQTFGETETVSYFIVTQVKFDFFLLIKSFFSSESFGCWNFDLMAV